ncbi:unnamed protein product, partial [Owenia fusiformis]
VLVTGASGFIASHIIKQLQTSGYRVRGTVRSLENEAKIKPLKELCPDAEHQLELVEADLLKPETWESAVKDCNYVIHTASPFPNQVVKDPETELIQPAVEGTTNVLKAIQAGKTVKRVVITSSIATVIGGETGVDTTKTYTEEDWANVDKLDGYSKSKTLAEKAAWDFLKELPEEERFEIATIQPGYVLGPIIHGSMCTSMEVPKKLLERAMPGLPKLNFNIVDVRDVAEAHIKAMTAPEAAGKRHIAVTHNMWIRDIASVIAEEYRPQGYNVPTWQLPNFAVWVGGMFDKTVKLTVPQLGKQYKLESTKLKEVLGIEPKDSKETILDMCSTMIEGGWVKKPKPKKQKASKAKKDEEAVENHVAEGSADAKNEEEKKEGEETEEKKEEEKPAESDEKPTEEKPEEKPEEKSEEKTEEKAEEK